jgi:hypothetical protein
MERIQKEVTTISGTIFAFSKSKTLNNLSKDRQSPGEDLNARSSDQKTEMLPTQP